MFIALWASVQNDQDSAWIVIILHQTGTLYPHAGWDETIYNYLYSKRQKWKNIPSWWPATQYSCAPYENFFRKSAIQSLEILWGKLHSCVPGCKGGVGWVKVIFVDVRPFNKNKSNKNDVDEASDTYDAIDWLIKNVPSNNGNVGVNWNFLSWFLCYHGSFPVILLWRRCESTGTGHRMVYRRRFSSYGLFPNGCFCLLLGIW